MPYQLFYPERVSNFCQIDAGCLSIYNARLTYRGPIAIAMVQLISQSKESRTLSGFYVFGSDHGAISDERGDLRDGR